MGSEAPWAGIDNFRGLPLRGHALDSTNNWFQLNIIWILQRGLERQPERERPGLPAWAGSVEKALATWHLARGLMWKRITGLPGREPKGKKSFRRRFECRKETRQPQKGNLSVSPVGAGADWYLPPLERCFLWTWLRRQLMLACGPTGAE